MTIICRKATSQDITALHKLIEGYASNGIMLPRSESAIGRSIDTFVVAEEHGTLIGCGSLCKLGADLVEIRSLGIADGYKGKGIGSRLVDVLMAEAKALNISKVMALTYEVPFFLKNGFQVVNKDIFPEKVWTDCVNCPKQECCDEIAVLKVIDLTAPTEELNFISK